MSSLWIRGIEERGRGRGLIYVSEGGRDGWH